MKVKYISLVMASTAMFVLLANTTNTIKQMSTECIEIEGEPYPQTSEALTLTTCLPKGCNEVGDPVIIQTKINTVMGVIRSVSDKIITVGYHAVQAGYTPCYKLSQCEIVSVRCFNCCDDRYFEIASCVLTEEAITASIGVSELPIGDIYIFSGDQNNPDCLYKYKGFGPISDPVNWVDMFGYLPARFNNLEGNSLEEFLSWLTLVFSGAGIGFNVNEDGDQIIVTVGDGSGFGPSSFSFSYTGGTISLDPNDGSGLSTTNIIVHGSGLPTAPYDWFIYVNDDSNAIYFNVGDNAMLLGYLDDGEPTTCSDVIGCLVTNIQAGAIDPEKYSMPEIAGPTWAIGSVTYGTPTLIADYSACDGTDIDDLILNLNACPSNPTSWVWVNVGGVVTLCAPTGTAVDTVAYGFPLAVIDFNGIPTTAGGAGSDVCAELAECIEARVGKVGVVGSNATTETAIEAAYASFASVTVRWTDADGDARISYKDVYNGWYHPVDKSITPVPIFTQTLLSSETQQILSTSNAIDLAPFGVPNDAKKVRIQCFISIEREGFRPPGGGEQVDVISAIEFRHNGGWIQATPLALKSKDIESMEYPRTEEFTNDYTLNVITPVVTGQFLIDAYSQNGTVGQAISRGTSLIYVHLLGWSR